MQPWPEDSTKRSRLTHIGSFVRAHGFGAQAFSLGGGGVDQGLGSVLIGLRFWISRKQGSAGVVGTLIED